MAVYGSKHRISQYHTGYETIENVNSIDERRSEIVRNIVFDCHLSHDWATNSNRKIGNRKQCFSPFVIRVSRSLR